MQMMQLRVFASLLLALILMGGRGAELSIRLAESDLFLLTTVAKSISFRNITYSSEYCTEKDTAPGGIFAYNETYVELKPGQGRSPACMAFWSDPVHDERSSQKKLGIAAAQKLLQDEKTGKTLNAYRMKHVLKKLSTPNETVHVYVLGGSETSGLYVHGYKGAWPAEIEKMWNWYGDNPKAVKGLGANIRFTNLAVGGTSSRWALHRLPSLILAQEEVDLVIIEYDINDCAMVEESDHAHERFLEWYELLLRRLLLLPNNVAVLYFNAAVSHSTGDELLARCFEYKQCYQLDALKRPLTEAYGIPMISQRDAIWVDFSCPPSARDWDCQSHSCAHPLWHGHQLMADIVHEFFTWGTETYINATARPAAATDATDAIAAAELPWDAATDAVVAGKLKEQDFLMVRGAKEDAWICFDYGSSVDRINSAYVAEKFEVSSGLGEGSAGAGIKIAKGTDDSHLKQLQKMHVHEEQYKHVKLVQMHSPCWQYAEDVKGRPDKMGWVISADERPPPKIDESSDTSVDVGADANEETQQHEQNSRRLRGGIQKHIKGNHHHHHHHHKDIHNYRRQQRRRHLGEEDVDSSDTVVGQSESTNSAKATTLKDNPSTCFGAFLTFQMKMGTRSQLALSVLGTYDKHIGIGMVSVSPPLTPSQIEENYIGPDSSYVNVGTLDTYFADDSNGKGFSLVMPLVIEQDPVGTFHTNATQNIRVTLLDANHEGHDLRARFEKRTPRLYPQKLKIVSISTC